MNKQEFIKTAYDKGFIEELEKHAGVKGVIMPLFKKYQQYPKMTTPGASRMAEKITDPNLRKSRLDIERANLKNRLQYAARGL